MEVAHIYANMSISLEELASQQEDTRNEIKRIVSNFKKETALRKTTESLKARL